MSKTVLLLSGPNLDQLGRRDASVYGSQTLDELVALATKRASERGFELRHHQASAESELIELIHAARVGIDAIVINPGALTHYSWSLRDALDIYTGPVVELHLSNPSARESFRHVSTVGGVVSGTIAGFGALGYSLAIDAIAQLIKD